MKSPYVGSLVPNEVATVQLLVLTKEIRQKKTGEPYLTLHLADRTGEIEAKMWDNVAEVLDAFQRDDFVKVKGLVQIYQNRVQFTVHRLRRLEEHEIDLADYFPCSERDPEAMFGELRGIIAGFSDANLRTLLDAVFADPERSRLFKMAPAAKSIHHACRGGLIEHVLSMCALSRLVGSHYPQIDVDLLTTGAVLHDIGKLEELSYARSFGYSSDGQLLGHITLGLRLLNKIFESLPGFPPRLRTLVEHMVLSHHGELEFGSPKTPMFAEALLLHHLDNLDSKMDAFRGALKRDRQVEGEFTNWIAPLERVLLKKELYLHPPVHATPPSAAPQPAAPVAAPAASEAAQPKTPFGEKLQAVLESHK
jgi:3'-5' exoribonuclease